MSKPDFPFWAKAEDVGQIITPPLVKIDRGHNAGQPTAAEFQNWHQNLVGKWIVGLQPSFADIIVGSLAQVNNGEADKTVNTFTAFVSAGDLVEFLDGTHIRTGSNIVITEDDVVFRGEPGAVLDVGAFTFSATGARNYLRLKIINAGTDEVVLSGAGSSAVLLDTPITVLDVGANGTGMSLNSGSMSFKGKAGFKGESAPVTPIQIDGSSKICLETDTTTQLSDIGSGSSNTGGLTINGGLLSVDSPVSMDLDYNTRGITGSSRRLQIKHDGTIVCFFGGGTEGSGSVGGMVLGNPTGSENGLGTLNAKAVFDDNVLLTCYPFHDDKTVAEWDAKVPNVRMYDDTGTDFTVVETEHGAVRRFRADKDRRVDIRKFTEFWQQQRHLPAFPSFDEWTPETRLGMGDVGQRTWETVECLAIHNAQLLEMCDALAARIAKLELQTKGAP